MKEKQMSWLEEQVSIALHHKCPIGFEVNENAVKGIVKGLIRTGGVCPCTHNEWNENTPIEDKLCPCNTFRIACDCHCNLYKRYEKY